MEVHAMTCGLISRALPAVQSEDAGPTDHVQNPLEQGRLGHEVWRQVRPPSCSSFLLLTDISPQVSPTLLAVLP